MQSNVRKRDSGRSRPSSVRPGDEAKQVSKVHTRKVPYKVGYTWNKGGRLKELRIRHLARKFLRIWIQNTFGRVLSQKAKSHYDSVTLRRAFEGWRDEWRASRREWSLTTRAECHYKYHLCSLAFQNWQVLMPLQGEKKKKVQTAQSIVDKHLTSQVLDRWEAFTQMRQKKRRMLETALELNKLASLHSAWRSWQTRLQQHRVLHALEKQALEDKALVLQRRAWLQWKSMHSTARKEREKESKAARYFDLKVKRKTLCCWKSYMTRLQAKKKSQALAQHFLHLRQMRMFWRKWCSALHLKRWQENCLQAAGSLAAQDTQHRALGDWKHYMTVCREEDDRNRIARQHHHHHLMCAGLEGLSRNITQNKKHWMNNNIADQHYCHTITVKYWKLWKVHLEKAEDKSLQLLRERALKKQRTSLLGNFFHHWREKLAERTHMRELEHRADIWFADWMFRQCFTSWVDFTLKRRLQKQREQEAEGYNNKKVIQSFLCRVCMISLFLRAFCPCALAFLQPKDTQVRQRQYAWVFYTWSSQAEERKNQRLLERIAIQHEEQHHLQTAWKRWKQRFEKIKLKQMQHYHEDKLLKNTFVAWQKHNLHVRQLHCHAEELHTQQRQKSLCNVMTVWRENATLLTEIRLMEQHAQNHFQHLLQLKVFHAWRKATTCAVSKRHQQEEAVVSAQRSINHVRLLQSFRGWRKKARDAHTERISMEKARWHHESTLCFKAMKGWKDHHSQYHKNKIMKRQGNLLLRLKVYQKYFEQWKTKLQHRRREAEQTERALWHWSLTLQAKVLHSWRLLVTEQRRKREQAARAAQVYRDQLLREGVSCILTYAAHMNDLTTTLTQYSEDQRPRRLQRLVRSCAMRWKQRALSKPQSQQEVQEAQPKKTVTFCLTSTEYRSISPCDSVEQEEEELSQLTLSGYHQGQLGGCEPLLEPTRNIITQRRPDVAGEDVLLPPSAFMTSRSENLLKKTSSSGFGDRFQQASASPDTCVSASSGETAQTDSTLITELLSIQLDMKTYQQDKKQLQAWQKLRDVLKSWLQTSGKDDQMEKKAVCEELRELEERMNRLSAELADRKPTILLQAERIQRLHSLLSDVS